MPAGQGGAGEHLQGAHSAGTGVRLPGEQWGRGGGETRVAESRAESPPPARGVLPAPPPPAWLLGFALGRATLQASALLVTQSRGHGAGGGLLSVVGPVSTWV